MIAGECEANDNPTPLSLNIIDVPVSVSLTYYKPTVRNFQVTSGKSSMLPLHSNTTSIYNNCALVMSWSEAGRPLGSSVLLCVWVCVSTMAWLVLQSHQPHFRFHPQFTEQNIDIHTQQTVVPILTMACSLLIMCLELIIVLCCGLLLHVLHICL